ncbi:YcbK family protein [Crenalkalicoccus roseus]|uniref:YcbK family protein n=1 Tax=Crenalkalicoccus roseus TaxID=1485588 RepID=UPI00108008FF|nr:DUF882 domain-containing protein [Crenalkalicoccus roseus]
MHRRTACCLAALAALAGAAPSLAASGQQGRWHAIAPRRLALRHAATGATFSGTWHNGVVPDAGAMRELSAVLADSRTGAVRPFDPRAIEILWELGERERIREFAVLSGYRTPGTNALVEGAADSQHLRAAALDLLIPSARLAAFGAAALALGRGGVGVYPARGFVHIDSGPVRRWGEVSARRAPAEDRLSRIAEAWAATQR